MLTRTMIVAALGIAIAMVATATQAEATQAQTLHFVEKGGGLKIVDNPPKARHRYDFSPGDIVVVSRHLYRETGSRAGSLRLVCIATTATTQQCTGTENLPGGTLELAGTSAPAPTTSTAVIGGTGVYANAHGTSASTDRKGNHNIADQTITLAP